MKEKKYKIVHDRDICIGCLRAQVFVHYIGIWKMMENLF